MMNVSWLQNGLEEENVEDKVRFKDEPHPWKGRRSSMHVPTVFSVAASAEHLKHRDVVS